ncbi:MAG: hypothetical protein HYZ28_20735 [Myxococcales bacterium]|nr:hypothetical protein [Myxococcales bacterium]
MRSRAASGGLFLFLAASLLRKVDDYDLWFYLNAGREVFRTGQVPPEEFYITPLLGQRGEFNEWGFGLLYFVVQRYSGWLGLAVVNAALAALALYLMHRTATRGRSLLEPLPVLALCATVAWLNYRLVYRAELTLFLSLAATVCLFERFLADRRWRWLLPMPALTLLHAQAHPSGLLVLGVFGLYSLQCILESPPGSRVRVGASLFGIGALSLLAAACNPYGWEQVFLPLRYALRGDVGLVTEFLPTLQTEQRWPYLCLLAVSAAAVALAPRRRPLELVLLLVFGYLGFRHARNVGLFALVMHLPIARAAGHLPERFAWLRSRGGLFASRLGQLAALVALPVLPAASGMWGYGLKERAFPQRAAAALKQLRPQGTVFNFYHLGSYLAWELDGAQTVFIDGRHNSLDISLIEHDRVLNAEPGWGEVLARYRASVILTPPTLPFSGKLIPLIPSLAQDDRWLLLEVEPNAMLFVRREAAGPSFERARDKRLIWEETVRAGAEVLRDYPSHADAHLSVARALVALGKPDAAVASYEEYLRQRPQDTATGKELELVRRLPRH